jgi:hypothetical protein
MIIMVVKYILAQSSARLMVCVLGPSTNPMQKEVSVRSLTNFFWRLSQGFLSHRVSPNSPRARLRPIPVAEWSCYCSRLWSDELVSAICSICNGRFERTPTITE